MPVEERAEEQSEGLSEVRPEALPEEQEQPAVSGLSRHRSLLLGVAVALELHENAELAGDVA